MHDPAQVALDAMRTQLQMAYAVTPGSYEWKVFMQNADEWDRRFFDMTGKGAGFDQWDNRRRGSGIKVS
jgi:hypothetical protein